MAGSRTARAIRETDDLPLVVACESTSSASARIGLGRTAIERLNNLIGEAAGTQGRQEGDSAPGTFQALELARD